ncbi:MAG: urea ABC transporter permease subunit UrtC [Synechococcaceae cyanobacterium SM2_3_1]|nr:urea ABC transporter permease subunit UrtC [Synechococcaceae cyanobacterium SM2_3_1]
MGKAILWRIFPVPHLIFGFLILLVPLVMGDDVFWLNRLATYLVYGMVALSISLCWGNSGILSLGQGGFFGLGAYAMAMSLKLLSPASDQGSGLPIPDFIFWNVPPGQEPTLPWLWIPFQSQWFGVFAAIAVPAILAAILGWFIFSGGVTGVFVSIITLSSVVILNLILVDQQAITNGFNGLTDLAFFQVGSFTFDPFSRSVYFLVAGVLLACLFASNALLNTRMGLIFRAIQADERRVSYFKYDVSLYKIAAYVIASAMAGLAGALYVICAEFANPTLTELSLSISFVIWSAVGGRTSLLGSTLGGISINLTQSLLSENELFLNIWQLIIGLLFIVIVLFLPNGLTDLVHKIWSLIRRPRVPATQLIVKRPDKAHSLP